MSDELLTASRQVLDEKKIKEERIRIEKINNMERILDNDLKPYKTFKSLTNPTKSVNVKLKTML